MPRNPAPREHEPDDVEPWPWTEALVEADSAQDSDKDSDGHVDPEDPVPVEPVDHSSPENSPPATAVPAIPPHIPIAIARLSGGKASLISVRVNAG